ncbi:MAG: DUF6677 family protein [Thermoanaerobaculia bacterium]
MSRWRAYVAMLLAFLIPGGGHFYLGKRDRAIVFAIIIPFMLVMGLWLQGKLYVPEPGRPLSVLASAASMGAGTIYFVARALGPWGNPSSITFEYGTAFALTAGLMNLLVILDTFDIARGRKR